MRPNSRNSGKSRSKGTTVGEVSGVHQIFALGTQTQAINPFQTSQSHLFHVNSATNIQKILNQTSKPMKSPPPKQRWSPFVKKSSTNSIKSRGGTSSRNKDSSAHHRESARDQSSQKLIQECKEPQGEHKLFVKASAKHPSTQLNTCLYTSPLLANTFTSALQAESQVSQAQMGTVTTLKNSPRPAPAVSGQFPPKKLSFVEISELVFSSGRKHPQTINNTQARPHVFHSPRGPSSPQTQAHALTSARKRYSASPGVVGLANSTATEARKIGSFGLKDMNDSTSSRIQPLTSGSPPRALREPQLHLSPGLMEELAQLRIETTQLKAILSNEKFRIKQCVSKETHALEAVFSSLMNAVSRLRDDMLLRLETQSSSLIAEISTSLKRVDNTIKAFDQIFEVSSKSQNKQTMGQLMECLNKAMVKPSKCPKKLTLCELEFEDVEQIVRSVTSNLEGLLRVQIYEQDQQLANSFNSRIEEVLNKMRQQPALRSQIRTTGGASPQLVNKTAEIFKKETSSQADVAVCRPYIANVERDSRSQPDLTEVHPQKEHPLKTRSSRQFGICFNPKAGHSIQNRFAFTEVQQAEDSLEMVEAASGNLVEDPSLSSSVIDHNHFPEDRRVGPLDLEADKENIGRLRNCLTGEKNHRPMKTENTVVKRVFKESLALECTETLRVLKDWEARPVAPEADQLARLQTFHQANNTVSEKRSKLRLEGQESPWHDRIGNQYELQTEQISYALGLECSDEILPPRRLTEDQVHYLEEENEV